MSAPHTVLPPEAIYKLQRAARVVPTTSDPQARAKAVEQANQWVRHKYPQYFK